MGERFNPYSTPTADDLEYRQMKQRIAELQAQVAELQENQQSWQEHDQGRIFAAKQMQLRIEELEAERDALKEIIDDGCPRCDCDIVLWLGKAVSD